MLNKILRSFGLPTTAKGWLIAIVAFIGFLILSKFINPLILIIIIAIIAGLVSGFYTQRKPRP